MKNRTKIFVQLISLLICYLSLNAQQDRFQTLEKKLRDLTQSVPGLNQKVETSVSNGSLQEFLKGLAATHNLNFNIDPAISQRVTSYFSNEKVFTVLLYLAKQYNLDFAFTGTIISISPYRDASVSLPPKPKELKISYNPAAELLTMDLQDDSLLNVAKKITQLSNKNVIVQPDLFSKRITGYIQELPVQNAIEKLALTNNFKLNKTNDDVFVLESLKADEEIISKQNYDDNSNIAVRKVNKNNNQASSTTINVSRDINGKKKISLNVVNTPIKDIIKAVSEQAGINYFVYSDISGNATATVQNMEFDEVLKYILQGTKYTFNTSNGVYMIGDRKDEGLRSHQMIQLKYRSVDSLLPVIPAELKQGVEIQEFKELNSFLLSGSDPQIKEITAFVKEVDKTVPMVMIEVILMDVKKSKIVQTGINMGVSDSVKTGGTLIGAGGTDFTFGANDINRFIDQLGLNNVFNIGRVSPKFYISLKALENNSNIDLRQTPKLSTLNGHTANLSIGSKRYYLQRTQNVLGSLNPQTLITEQYIPLEANLTIDIKPFVSGDEQVTLNIDVNISDFIGDTPINVPPPSSTSKFKSIIRVKNEEMVVLGGIERNEKSETGSGTPFLSRIPILKWFFSSRSKTNAKTVSVVFIKPTIIYQ
jgi:type IV pilus assembly protein PilQ